MKQGTLETPSGKTPGKASRKVSGNRRTLRILLLVALTISVMVIYGCSTGELGVSDKPHALLKDDGLNFISALIGGFALTGAILALYLNQTQLEATLEEFRESNHLIHYAELDRLYFDLLKVALEHPHLRNPASIGNDALRRQQYDTYAYMVWNFIETVIDRVEMEKAIACRGNPASGSSTAPSPSEQRSAGMVQSLATSPAPKTTQAQDAGATGEKSADDTCGLKLQATWQAAIRAEVGIHGAWLTESKAALFKDNFSALVKDYCRPVTARNPA